MVSYYLVLQQLECRIKLCAQYEFILTTAASMNIAIVKSILTTLTLLERL